MAGAVSLEAQSHGGVEVVVDPAARRDGVMVAFSNRNGGVSAAPYDSLNLAARVGDDPAAVETNRSRVAAAVGFELARLNLARQVHGAKLLEVGDTDSGVVGEADGLVSRKSGPVLAILTADCAPVVVRGDRGLAVLHAGWRGLVAGVLEAGLAAIAPARAAWVGPSIRSCCYEVGPEVVEAFDSRSLPVAAPNRVDPADAAVAVLEREGVGDIASASQCTHCDPDYFSYRRDGVTGRQGAFAALVG